MQNVIKSVINLLDDNDINDICNTIINKYDINNTGNLEYDDINYLLKDNLALSKTADNDGLQFMNSNNFNANKNYISNKDIKNYISNLFGARDNNNIINNNKIDNAKKLFYNKYNSTSKSFNNITSSKSIFKSKNSKFIKSFSGISVEKDIDTMDTFNKYKQLLINDKGVEYTNNLLNKAATTFNNILDNGDSSKNKRRIWDYNSMEQFLLETEKVNNYKFDEQQINDYFKMIDINGDGEITIVEFMLYIISLELNFMHLMD